MKIKFIRNGRIWYNNSSGNGEEIMDIYIGDNPKPLQRGMCFLFFKKVTGIEIKPKESMEFEFNKIA